MIDDDMTFAYRPNMGEPTLHTLPPRNKKITELFEYWYELAHEYAHVGLSARQGNNRVTEPYKEFGRLYNAYTYDLKKIRDSGCVLGRMQLMEDFDLSLQLLRAGHKNALIYRWCWNQAGSNADGGCSQYRTGEMQATCAHRLAKLHPGFVRVVEKKSKNWKDMEVRTDVVVSWKKAWESSQ
jgi:hypothetical protein